MNEAKQTKTAEEIAQQAMELSRAQLPDYGAVRSRHDFTQHQLMACLVLREHLATTYRGLYETLKVNTALRDCLGMSEKLPHYTTLQKFSARGNVAVIAQQLVQCLGQNPESPL